MKHGQVLESISASVSDCKALANGCSDYERQLRRLGVAFYGGDAMLREASINFAVIKSAIMGKRGAK